MNLPETLNIDYIDAQYARWKQNPADVSEDWRHFFQGFDIALEQAGEAGPVDDDRVLAQSRVEALKYRYRDLGHLLACMDPLDECQIDHPLLALDAFGLSEDALDQTFFTRRFSRSRRAPLKDIIAVLKETYCRSVGVEYMHLQDPDERRWLQDRMEPVRNRPQLKDDHKRRILEKLTASAQFEQFLNKKYVGVTRFSLEGADALIPLLDTAVSHASEVGCREIILGMAHRGRLNVQAHILGKPYEEIFSEFESCYDPDQLVGAGDVKYHNGYLADLETGSKQQVRLFMVNNPSHLEAVDPVVLGAVRARQDLLEDADRQRIMPVLMHGDAAFAGQGVVAEVLNMSQLSGYQTGGCLHVIINNQIGYTTTPEDARSTRYATDVAKMLMVPIFHVHGEDPEAVVHVARLAVDYRMAFGKDAVIDLVCYRRYGHNEGDEPYFTQPRMYDRIRHRPSPDALYAEKLMEEKIVDESAVRDMQEKTSRPLQEAYDEVHGSACPFPESTFYEVWEPYTGRATDPPTDTTADSDTLLALSEAINTVPDDFHLNRKLRRMVEKRHEAIQTNSGIDWANAEALAFAALVSDGRDVRLSGQDCARGTFSQRHSVWVDTEDSRTYVPLNAVASGNARYRVYNSLLAEYSVLGFEYGYAMIRPDALVMWEAQFGDFVNNAQSVIDLFIAAGEAKWQRLNGLTLLLPHGYEGMGPEHSSARLERFLQLCAEDNIRVSYPTTPAQYFHLLRRQVLSPVRKPLVVMTPKSLLRLPEAVSTRDDLAGGGFSPVIDDPDADPAASTLLLCSGKIYYELVARRKKREASDPAVVRVEQLYPFPESALEAIFKSYPDIRQLCWVQEEPENMGAWWFVRPRLEKMTDGAVTCISRPAAASPATGFPHIYRRQQETIISSAVGALPA